MLKHIEGNFADFAGRVYDVTITRLAIVGAR